MARLVHEIAAASALNVIARRLVNIGLNVDVCRCVSIYVCVCEVYRVYRQGINQLKNKHSSSTFLTLFYAQ